MVELFTGESEIAEGAQLILSAETMGVSNKRIGNRACFRTAQWKENETYSVERFFDSVGIKYTKQELNGSFTYDKYDGGDQEEYEIGEVIMFDPRALGCVDICYAS